MKIKFLADFRPQGQADNIPSYVAGDVYAFDGPVAEGYARKYIDRGLAEEAKPAAKVAPVAAPEPKPEPKPEPEAETAKEEAPVEEAKAERPFTHSWGKKRR